MKDRENLLMFIASTLATFVGINDIAYRDMSKAAKVADIVLTTLIGGLAGYFGCRWLNGDDK